VLAHGELFKKVLMLRINVLLESGDAFQEFFDRHTSKIRHGVFRRIGQAWHLRPRRIGSGWPETGSLAVASGVAPEQSRSDYRTALVRLHFAPDDFRRNCYR
jgi:hypothetical protein